MECFIAKGTFNTERQINYGYGGGTLASEIIPCPTGYEYFGHACTHFPIRSPESYTEAVNVCNEEGDMVYFSDDKLQGHLFRETMTFMVRERSKKQHIFY